MTKHSSTSLLQVTALFFLLVFFFSCKKAELNTEPIVSAAKAGGGGSTLQQVNLTVEIVDFDGAKIRSDGGLYEHGSGKIAAFLDANGNFIFDTYTGMSRNSPIPAERSLTFIFDRPFSGTNTRVVYDSKNGNYRLVTLLQKGGTPLQNMGNGTGQDISMGGGFRRPSSNTADWNFSMRYNAENISTSITNYAKVLRTGVDSWEITGAVADPVSALRINGETTPGYYYLPFKLILTRKP